MKRAFLILSVLLAAVPWATAALNVSMKDGTTLVAENAISDGAKIRLTLAGGQSRSVDPASIERIDMPEPEALTATYAAYNSGDNLKTLTAMGKLAVDLEPFKNVAGARDWWLEGEFLRAHILISQKRFKEVEPNMKALAADAADPAVAARANAFLIYVASQSGGDPRKTLADLKELILKATDPEVLADAWLFTGHAHAAVNEPLLAATAYLRVPVFYPERQLPLAGARLGAARALIALEKPLAAVPILKDLVAQQAATPEGAEGKKLLAQVQKDITGAAASPTTEESTGK